MAHHNWQQGREQQERDIKVTLERAGIPEREAADFARRRAEEGMRRATHIAHEEGTSRPTEIRSK